MKQSNNNKKSRDVTAFLYERLWQSVLPVALPTALVIIFRGQSRRGPPIPIRHHVGHDSQLPPRMIQHSNRLFFV